MNFTQAVESSFRRYVDFRSRSSRSEYWWWALFAFTGAIVALVLDGVIGTSGLIYYDISQMDSSAFINTRS